jgi:hypothetical protein
MLLLHIIGAVGAGKTTMIRQFWPTYQVFDIKDVYTFFQFTPEDLRDSEKYQSFANGVASELEGYCMECELAEQPIGIVESSGINKALNAALSQYEVCTIWIEGDPTQASTPEFEQSHPYAASLNAEILRQITDGKITTNLKFSMLTQTWSGKVPPPFEPVLYFVYNTFTEIKPDPIKNSNNEEFEIYRDGKSYRCPSCGAEFSKGNYLQKHFNRYPECI